MKNYTYYVFFHYADSQYTSGLGHGFEYVTVDYKINSEENMDKLIRFVKDNIKEPIPHEKYLGIISFYLLNEADVPDKDEIQIGPFSAT